TVHNTGAGATNGWQIEIDMPYQITDIWNATIVSHSANGYIIGNAAWNGQIAHDGQIDFGFIGTGPVNLASVQVHAVGQAPTPVALPTVPTGLAASNVTASSTDLSWNASNVPGGGTVTGYGIFANGHQIATTTDTHYTV